MRATANTNNNGEDWEKNQMLTCKGNADADPENGCSDNNDTMLFNSFPEQEVDKAPETKCDAKYQYGP